jgi:plasmid stabilization system protein ParE
MVKWTPRSEEDLDQIREHIAQNFNVDLAIETVNEIIDQVESILSKNPLAGLILESNPLFSKLVVQGNLVYYCENSKDHDLYIVYVQARSTDFQGQRLTGEEIAK